MELTPADVAYLVAAHPGITGAVPQVLHAQVRALHSFRTGGMWQPRTASACAAVAVAVPWLRSCAANW
eukprot:COSAG01_NODE_3263_length_6335_cov_6.514593_6_plen_68_part_00